MPKINESILFISNLLTREKLLMTGFLIVNPVVSADENTMVYTREAQFQDMIVFTRER